MNLSFGQLMITEIMYNSPDPGQDSLEYIEIYNTGDAVNLDGYSMLGVTYDFPGQILAAQDFYYIAVDIDAFFNTFGVNADEFGGALSNGGEDIAIIDPNGVEVFVVDFDDSAPWPTEEDGTDGAGASITLCDLDNPNDGVSWRASSTSTGKFFNGMEILASINSIEDEACNSPVGIVVTTDGLTFVPQDITINQGETITFTNGGGTHNVNGGQDIFPDNPASFFSGTPSADSWEYTYTFNLDGLYNYQCDLHVAQGMVGTVTVVPPPPSEVDLRVTEVFYNSSVLPDTLEFIEFYNAGNDPVTFDSYTLSTTAIATTLVASPLAPGEYGVIVKDLSAFMQAFPGVPVLGEWGEGTLSNSGDNIVITDEFGTEVVNVSYDDASGWPMEADGFGSTLITCDTEGGFVLENIQASTYPEVVFEDNTFYASPAQENYCSYNVDEVTQVSVSGVNTSLDLNSILSGTVYGINLRPGGLQFTLIDDNGDGISVFSASENFGYTVNETDEVTLIGSIGQFSGLSQIYLDSIIFNNAGSIEAPVVVTELNEDTESQFVRIENVSMVDPSQWVSTGGSFNIQVTDGTNTYDVRFDNDVTGIQGQNYPTGTFNVTGIGGQFDGLDPFTEGYQILPRYVTDIDPFVQFVEPYPFREVSDLKTNDLNGVADSLEVKCTIEGRVLGPNYRSSGLQFTLVNDNNEGIAVFISDQDFGYSVTEGDLIEIKGTIDQFNGLTEIIPDSLKFISSGSITNIDEVSVLDESTESSFILINTPLQLVNADDWKGDGTSYSFFVQDEDGNQYEVYIDNDIDASTEGFNPNPFTLRGIGSQRDVSSPFTEGYRITPRSYSDFDFIVSTNNIDISSEINVYPNPASNQITISYDGSLSKISLYTILGEFISDYSDLVISTQNLDSGQYMLKIYTENGIGTKKITIVK